MAAKSGTNSNVSSFHRRLLYYPVGQKFARNCSISYGFRDIHTFSFSVKNPRWLPKVAKIQIFPLLTGYSCTILWVKNLLEISLSLTVFEIFTLFHFPQKSKMAAKVAKIEIFPLCKGYSCTTLWVKNSLKITLSLMVFEIFMIFHFPLKSKMAAKSGDN